MAIEFKIEDFLPREPSQGPPLPKFLNIYWPWYKEEEEPLAEEPEPPEEWLRLKPGTYNIPIVDYGTVGQAWETWIEFYNARGRPGGFCALDEARTFALMPHMQDPETFYAKARELQQACEAEAGPW